MKSIKVEVRAQKWDHVRDSLIEYLVCNRVQNQVLHQVLNQLWDQVWHQVRDQIWDQVWYIRTDSNRI